MDATTTDHPAAGDDLTLTLERVFRAAPALVYAAWTEPEALPRWFGPEGFTCTTHAIDVRVGGEWRFDMTGHCMTFPNRHRWTDLVPGERIAFVLDAGSDAEPPMRVEVRLVPEGGGTRLRQTVTFPSAEALDRARGYEAEQRGQETLAKLAAHLGE